MKKKAVICDIDGVLLDSEHIFDKINELGLSGNDKWEYFNRHANDVDVIANKNVIDLLSAFDSAGIRIIFLTARSQEIEAQTRAKLDMVIGQFAENIFSYILLMRDIDDKSESCAVKKFWLDCIRNQYDVICAIDDDSSNCEMFKDNDILTLQVHRKRG